MNYSIADGLKEKESTKSIADGLKEFTNSIANSPSKGKPKPQEVDLMADEVSRTLNTPSYRPWYCQLCYRLGVNRVRELLARAQRGGKPAHLFSHLAKLEEDAWKAKQRAGS